MNNFFISFLMFTFILKVQTSQATIPQYLKGCDEYDDNFGCKKCYFGYTQQYDPQNKYYSCLKCPDGCLECANPSQCQKCFDSFYRTSDLKCKRCKDSCKKCESFDFCTECNLGFLYDKEKMECNACVENCMVCSTTKSCDKCFLGFPKSQDGLRCIDFNINSSKFWMVYGAVSIFGLIIMLFFLCSNICDGCCSVIIEEREADLRYSFLHSREEHKISEKQGVEDLKEIKANLFSEFDYSSPNKKEL